MVSLSEARMLVDGVSVLLSTSSNTAEAKTGVGNVQKAKPHLFLAAPHKPSNWEVHDALVPLPVLCVPSRPVPSPESHT